MKHTRTFFLAIVAVVLAALATPASAQFQTISQAPLSGSSCPYVQSLGIDLSTGDVSGCGNNHIWAGVGAATTQTFTNKTFDTAGTGNVFEINGVAITDVTGTGKVVLQTSPTLVTPVLGVASATSISSGKLALTAGGASGATANLAAATAPTTSVLGDLYVDAANQKALVFAPVAAAKYAVSLSPGSLNTASSTADTTTNDTPIGSGILVKANTLSVAGKVLKVRVDGVYTSGAASLLEGKIAFCTVAGCGSGTVLIPAGCNIASTNQANNATNYQFTLECRFITATTGATGTLMSKGTFCANLGSATTVALSCFADTSTAASAAVDLTVDEYIQPMWKFQSSNAANTVTAQTVVVEIAN